VALEGDTLIVTPTGDLSELEFQAVDSGGAEVLRSLEESGAKNVVLDLRRLDHTGSSALGFFVRLLTRVRSRHGRMALFNVSEHEREILEVTNLSGLWPLCASREAALAAVGG
jgi:anti-anti-sigma factor